MTKLSKWFPFKRGDKKVPIKRDEGQASAPVAQLQRDINRAFDGFWNDPFSSMMRRPFSMRDRMDDWFGDFSPSSFSPSIDIADEGKQLKITAELPGMSAEDIELHLKDNMLTLKGEKKIEESKEEEGFYRTERSYGYFQRSIPLPVEVDDEHAEAMFKKGVLTVRIPKTETEKGKQIEVKSA